MDRNFIAQIKNIKKAHVALRKESVDRNVWISFSTIILYAVALRKESVDRNTFSVATPHHPQRSLSARRAWIEIVSVAQATLLTGSLSARRAWIEIRAVNSSLVIKLVALRKESVDRNNDDIVAPGIVAGVALRKESVDRNGFGAKLVHSFLCRSPQGERG